VSRDSFKGAAKKLPQAKNMQVKALFCYINKMLAGPVHKFKMGNVCSEFSVAFL
jgi:hypothetical protein